jgi:hypothetical protein
MFELSDPLMKLLKNARARPDRALASGTAKRPQKRHAKPRRLARQLCLFWAARICGFEASPVAFVGRKSRYVFGLENLHKGHYE